ncbi:MAG: hypothetical protein HY674_10995 [Chloroflexi bacterium]|nr:hypothetical protein [Chloroflexota bacterium]
MASGTIATFVPDPPEPTTVRVFLYGGSQQEGGVAEFRVYRDGNPNLAFTVGYTTTTNGTALPDVNFLPQTGTLNFAPGELLKTIQIPIINDGLLNFALSFGIRLSNATAGVRIEEENASARIFDSQYPTAFDWSFSPDYKSATRAAVAATRADGQLLVAERVLTGQKEVARLVILSSDGARLAEWPTLFESGYVSSLWFLEGGKVLAVGAFTNVSGLPRPGIARLNPDGSVDRAFDPIIPDSAVIDFDYLRPAAVTTLPDGSVLAVTVKRPWDGSYQRLIIRLNPDGRTDPAFKPVQLDGLVWKIVPDLQGRILVGGQFERVGDIGRPGLARLNSDGSLDTGFAPELADSPGVEDIALQRDGKILIVGAFSTVNGMLRQNLARLNEDGSTDETFQYRPGMPKVFLVQADTDGTLLAAGWGVLQRLAADGTQMRALSGIPIVSIFSSKNGTVLASIALGDVGTLLARILLDQPPRTAMVISSSDYFIPYRPFDTRLETTEFPDSDALPIVVRRLGDVIEPATVRVTTRDGTAQSGEDYIAINQTLNFAPFEQEKWLWIGTLADNVFDPDETFDLVLTGVSGVEAVGPPVKVTINDGFARVLPDKLKRLPDGAVEVTFYLPPVRAWDGLEASSDLRTWSRVAVVGDAIPDPSLGPNRYRLVDRQAEDFPVRFYRLQAQ